MTLAEEAAEILKGAIAGKYIVKLLPNGISWHGMYAGNVTFIIEGWKFVIFNDCDSFDYIDSIKSPDGREEKFDDWWNDEDGSLITYPPENYLNGNEQDKLERLLEEAKY